MRGIGQWDHERALERERARISQDMHDEVGSSLTEIFILSEIVKKNMQGSGSELQIARISEKSREAIDNIGEIIWAINPKNDMLEDLLSYIRHYAFQYFRMTTIRCQCDSPEEVPACRLTAHERRNIFLVVKEAFRNVVKHSSTTEATIKFACSGGNIIILLQDNGNGFSLHDLAHHGNGLTNMKIRMENIGGKLEIRSEPGFGTTILIVAPADCEIVLDRRMPHMDD